MAEKQTLFAAAKEYYGTLGVDAERGFDYTGRLALQEAAKAMPWGIIWNEWCERHNVPSDFGLMKEIRDYERSVLLARN